MLSRLTIQDFAVATAVEMQFTRGFTVISGETGAGKSLLVDALGFLAGLRADSAMVRHGAARAELDAQFDLDDAPAAVTWLREQELDVADASCQLRRTLHADGGSRAWINGRNATLLQLAQLSGLLFEIHGQHEHQALLSRTSQLDLLDAFGRHAPLRADVAAMARQWSAMVDERDRLSQQGQAADRIAWLEHQASELADERLEPAVIEQLVATHRRQAHAAELIAGCDGALVALTGDDAPSLPTQLQTLRADLARHAAHEPRLREADALLDAASIQLAETARLVEHVRADLEVDPAQLQALDRDLQRLHDLARKHRVAPTALAARRDQITAELLVLHAAGERLRGLDVEIDAAGRCWGESAARLSDARSAAAGVLAETTSGLLAELGMPGGLLEIALQPTPRQQPDPQGAERVEFRVAANPGQPPRALHKVASGGELSRISLAIEVAALGLDAVPTMVFDEVDAGIGGAVAEIVGQKLRSLGARRQVLCVTHLPQVAALGHAHYAVRKATVDGATHSTAEQLDAAAREAEIARMLGGVAVGPEVRAAARRMLRSAR